MDLQKLYSFISVPVYHFSSTSRIMRDPVERQLPAVEYNDKT